MDSKHIYINTTLFSIFQMYSMYDISCHIRIVACHEFQTYLHKYDIFFIRTLSTIIYWSKYAMYSKLCYITRHIPKYDNYFHIQIVSSKVFQNVLHNTTYSTYTIYSITFESQPMIHSICVYINTTYSKYVTTVTFTSQLVHGSQNIFT